MEVTLTSEMSSETRPFVPDRILGIDPAKNHTGLALLDQSGRFLKFEQFNGKGEPDILAATKLVAQSFAAYLRKVAPAGRTLYCMEKQLSVGGQMSALQFYVQMRLLEEIDFHDARACLVFPLPVQLKSYMRRRYGVLNTGVASERVQAVRKRVSPDPPVGRISQHKADGWFAARLGWEVVKGTWSYKPPSKEQKLTNLRILYG